MESDKKQAPCQNGNNHDQNENRLEIPINNNLNNLPRRRRASSAKIADLRGENFRDGELPNLTSITDIFEERGIQRKMSSRKPNTVRFMSKNGRCNIRQVICEILDAVF